MDKIKEAFIREYFNVFRITKDITRMFATKQALEDLELVRLRSSPEGDYQLFESRTVPNTLIFIDKAEYKGSGHIYIRRVKVRKPR